MLDSALEQSFTELTSRGQGVEVTDVVDPQRSRDDEQPTRRERPARPRQERSDRDERGRFVARETDDDEVDAYDVLEAEEPQEPTRRRRTTRASEPTEDDDDFEELEDDDDPTAARRRSDDADEAELEDDDELELEGDLEPGDEGDDEGEPRQARAREGDRRRERRPSRRMQRWLDREVERRVGKVVAQNEALRAEQQKRDAAAAQGVQFLIRAIGTPQELERLESIALDTRRPQAERDRASRTLATYRENKKFALQYREGLLADIRANQAREDQAAQQAMRQLKALDPKVVAKGDRAETLVHAYVTGRALGQQEGAAEIKRLKRALANAKGLREERRVTRRMGDRSAGVARAGERRANGRPGRPDPLRNVMERGRGIGNGSTFVSPTDQMLDAIKNGEATLADFGLGRVTI